MREGDYFGWEALWQLGFVLWGGDKTWLAPQDRWTDGDPFLDLDSGAYDCRLTGLAAR